ncbi:MAG: SusC/RagA family TonB-linked outer membrane protein, partial [Pedobacter sp.]
MKFFTSKFMRIMRLTIVIITIALMQVSAAGLAQKVSLSFKNVPLEQVLVAVKQQTAYNFVYTEDVIAKAKRVTIQVKNADLKDVLQVCFQNQPLNFTIQQNTIVVKEREPSLLDNASVTLNLFQGLIDIRGKVVDENNQPLPGATVKVKGGTQGVMTDKEGDFFLKGVPDDAVLVFAYMGYKAVELKAEANMGLIKLEQNLQELQEVVINRGYYETTRELNTGSVSRVDAKTIGKQPVLNPLAAIAGRMPGVVIQQSTGIPGGDFYIEIRGRNNLRNEGNDPLYIIDGVPFSSEKVSSPFVTAGIFAGNYNNSSPAGASPLNGINNADIESIEILKDADATAIYGSRGANGVILITTKKGKTGKTKFNLDVYSGAGKVRTISLLNTEEYLAMRKQAFVNDGITVYPSEAYDVNGTWDQSRYTDWQKVLLGGTARTTSVQGSLTGGSEGTQFLFSTGYRKETSVFPGQLAFTKFSAHSSLNHISPNKKLTLGLSLTGNADKNNQIQLGYTNYARSLAPNAPALYNVDGTLNWENSTWRNPLAELLRPFSASTSSFISNAIIG